MSLLDITGLSHTYGDSCLYSDSDLSLNHGEHMGIVGQNGTGKSTLIKICTEQVIPDSGRVVWQPGITIGYLDQYANTHHGMTMERFLKSSFASLYELETKMTKLYDEAASACNMDAQNQASLYQEELERSGFYSIDTRIAQVVTGLGLTAIGLSRPLEDMSGGQRAKVILAKLLLEKPDVLLLDEPTNFLDKEHVEWLGCYLSTTENAFMVVSHDHAFLERICTRICDIDNGRLTKYYGTYSEFLKKKAFLRENHIRQYNAQQKQIRQTEEFIRKNIAGRKSQMARGRQKQLDRMEKLEALDLKEIKPEFYFQCLPLTKCLHLSVKRLSVGYDYPILSHLDFSVTGGQKVVVTGFNGIGKSTLLKTLTENLAPLSGIFTFSQQVTIGYFDQELVWENDMLTPIQIVSNAYPELILKKIRRHLTRCGILSRQAMQPMGTLSGGEQAKVKLCLLTLSPCNFLIMDEPTNHLDIQAKEALKTALKSFPGTILLVSHEESFYRSWADRIIHIGDHTSP
ncbi:MULTISPECIES: ABC-F family ATP-binding cassette domain-containing protein [unclassified Clostridium]|uniref:ABC-F family ATP-binding cassette domain-containing protein n=1 Tax=unclassified Clostridium TaxID=2614128 RepID=UPI0011058AD7|nr:MULTISPECIES: ABC-F family ATP-binding cassette domain-containing protein [unclassified Clostridium]